MRGRLCRAEVSTTGPGKKGPEQGKTSALSWDGNRDLGPALCTGFSPSSQTSVCSITAQIHLCCFFWGGGLFWYFLNEVKLPALRVRTIPSAETLSSSLRVGDTGSSLRGHSLLPAHLLSHLPKEGGAQDSPHSSTQKIYSRLIGASNDLATVTITLVPKT